MKKKKYLVITVTILLLVALIGTISLNVFADTDDNVICKGVYIDTVDVGNMTAEQAEAAVDEYVEGLMKKTVTIDVDGKTVKTTMADLGYSVEDHNYIEEALKAGKSGNLIKRYKELKDIEKNGLVFELEFTLDDAKIDELVEDCSEYDVEAVNASIKRVNGSFVTTEHQTGRKVNVEKTKELIKQAIVDEWNREDVELTAVVEVAQPSVTREMANKCNDVLGSYSTTYSDSSANRANNLANGAKKINGTVVYPGETFSAYQVLSPFTTDNGWSAAGAYNNGKVVDSVGGGVCQVSTTLYNALLAAELEIVERAPHSMIVGYVDPAKDAAIAGTWKDLKFKNNTDVPVYIEAYTSGRTITFKIYGEETRASNRTVKYISEVLEKTNPPADVITEDSSQPTTYRKVTQSAHYGYKANLWKVVYINGVEQSREKVNYSSYAAAPAYITVGTKEKEPEATATPKPEESESPTKTPKPTATPKPTKEPAATKEPATTAPATATPAPTEAPASGEAENAQVSE